ncbi:hypothetical protein UFOVP451_26 [uncultured Caudovirales phage]|uniref:Uncharacterized protein n=1 Tax=uncultured Caudovirales phage TaxID=2100421 RepID=A0A6J5MBJ9_9CAUD|nr:hypothetical protein UFOVP451_26 [uncultured Caudovirales phage]
MVNVLWFVLGGLFGSVLTVAYIRSQQLKAMHEMITRMTKDLIKNGGNNDGN